MRSRCIERLKISICKWIKQKFMVFRNCSSIYKGADFPDPKMKCLFACVLEEKNLLTDKGTINIVPIVAIVNTLHAKSHDILFKVAAKCPPNFRQKNICEKFYQVHVCMRRTDPVHYYFWKYITCINTVFYFSNFFYWEKGSIGFIQLTYSVLYPPLFIVISNENLALNPNMDKCRTVFDIWVNFHF